MRWRSISLSQQFTKFLQLFDRRIGEIKIFNQNR